MSQLQIQLEDELIALLRQSNQTADQAVREMIIIELYRRGVLSSGKAAQLLGIGRVEFIQYASRLGVPYYDMTADEWQAERAHAEQL